MKSKTFIGFKRDGGQIIAAEMRGVVTDSGYLEHYIDGELRAVVPPEGQTDYVMDWPDLAALVKEAAPVENA